MSSRSIDDLHPLFQSRAREFLIAAKAAGLDVLLYCGYRSREEQDELYAQGRTKLGKIVTNARAGFSAHNYGLAFDAVPIVYGKPAWDDHAAWETYGNVAASVGLEWAGTWQSFKEFPHVQMPNWKSVAGLA
jgi:peptidoglycan L-alanyl-D-glutamate endopeptidase CwlK